jgi:hypothetical protein
MPVCHSKPEMLGHGFIANLTFCVIVFKRQRIPGIVSFKFYLWDILKKLVVRVFHFEMI